ncbi:MAG TPA: GtrA family protein [Candidatus Moranbacteria bacterium]|nr:GtrA family protein [Candidatus Moranbacteria bacterium]
MKINSEAMPKKDFWLGILSGFLIGLMFMPVLAVAKPDLYIRLKMAILPFFLIGTPLGLAIAHLIGKKIPLIWQLGKFVVTGVLNVLVDFGVLTLLTIYLKKYFEISSTDILLSLGVLVVSVYSLYKALSFTVANINSYFWNKYWTFGEKGGKKSEFVQFFIVSIVGFIINVAVASFVFKYIHPFSGMNYDQWGLIGAAFGSIVGLVWNFLGYKFLVFKK